MRHVEGVERVALAAHVCFLGVSASGSLCDMQERRSVHL